MDRWHNRVAVVTGASSGIGAATLKDLANAGLIVVGLSRRTIRTHQIRLDLPKELQSRVHAIKCDVMIEENVKDAFKWIDENLGGTDILINCAGLVQFGSLLSEMNMKLIKDIFDTQVMGVLFCTREAFRSMKTRNFDGHVVMVNSIDGHYIPVMMGADFPSLNMYPPSKYALTAMTETYRQEFADAGTKIKLTSISPGLVLTEIGNYIMQSFDMPMLQAHDISNAILYCIGTPPHVQINELIIRPLGESF